MCLLNEMVCLALANLLCIFFTFPFFWQVQAEGVIFCGPRMLFHTFLGFVTSPGRPYNLQNTDLCLRFFAKSCQTLTFLLAALASLS